jgi:hypothetical protein
LAYAFSANITHKLLDANFAFFQCAKANLF